ncbi:MAG TPA: dolichyl-phosphate-mannose--protein mannosyltransferase, partial [Stenotrophomonas sp.]|nr:dolichyl-phosphate-mannose--protein mannosyltransferase [Stenotrophomonas sp.]
MQWVLGGFTLLLSLGTLAAGASALLGNPGFEVRLVLERGLEPGAVVVMAWAVLAMGAAGAAGLLLFGPTRRHLALVSMLTVVWVLYSLVGYPVLNDSSSARGLMRSVDARLGTDA